MTTKGRECHLWWCKWEKQMGQCVTLGAFLHAEQKLHSDSDTCVPAQRDDSDVACHNGRTQQVLDRGGAIRITVKHLRMEQ